MILRLILGLLNHGIIINKFIYVFSTRCININNKEVTYKIKALIFESYIILASFFLLIISSCLIIDKALIVI